MLMAAKNETKNVITGGEVKPVRMVRNETSPVDFYLFFLVFIFICKMKIKTNKSVLRFYS